MQIQQIAQKTDTIKPSGTWKRKSESSRSPSPIDTILSLHSTLGNRAIQRLIVSGAIQPKLKIGAPNDKYEQEADRVANQVMRMPDPKPSVSPQQSVSVQRKCAACENGGASCSECADEELVQRQAIKGGDKIQRRADIRTNALPSVPRVTTRTESKIHSLRGSGQPLSPGTRAFMEPRFGRDFSEVRVHTDGRANQLARAVQAKAFALGSDVVFGSGHYSPNSIQGQHLLAHELTHTIQQSRSTGGPGANYSAPDISSSIPRIARVKSLCSGQEMYTVEERVCHNVVLISRQNPKDSNKLVQYFKDNIPTSKIKSIMAMLKNINHSVTKVIKKEFGDPVRIRIVNTLKAMSTNKADSSTPSSAPGDKPVSSKSTPPPKPPEEPKPKEEPKPEKEPSSPCGMGECIPAPAAGARPPDPPPPLNKPSPRPDTCPDRTWPPKDWNPPTPPRYSKLDATLIAKLAESYINHKVDSASLLNGFSGTDPKCPAWWPRTLWEALDNLGSGLLDVIEQVSNRAKLYPDLWGGITRIRGVWSTSSQGFKFYTSVYSGVDTFLINDKNFCRDSPISEAYYHHGQQCWREVGRVGKPGLHVCLGMNRSPDIHIDPHQIAEGKNEDGTCNINAAAWAEHVWDVL